MLIGDRWAWRRSGGLSYTCSILKTRVLLYNNSNAVLLS